MTEDDLKAIETRMVVARTEQEPFERLRAYWLILTTDMPLLLAEVRRLRSEVEKAQPYIRAWHKGAGAPP